MSKEYFAMPELWAAAEKFGANNMDMVNLCLELRGRVEALEAAQPRICFGPESPLVERVADAIAAEATSAGIVNDRPARAAILEVSEWLAEQSITITGQAWAAQLEIEAKGPMTEPRIVKLPRNGPKPPSLKEQALQALRHAPGPDYPNPITLLTADEHALIRRALEQLDD